MFCVSYLLKTLSSIHKKPAGIWQQYTDPDSQLSCSRDSSADVWSASNSPPGWDRLVPGCVQWLATSQYTHLWSMEETSTLRSWRVYDMETHSVSLAFCERNPTVTGGFPFSLQISFMLLSPAVEITVELPAIWNAATYIGYHCNGTGSYFIKYLPNTNNRHFRAIFHEIKVWIMFKLHCSGEHMGSPTYSQNIHILQIWGGGLWGAFWEI